MGSGGKKKTTMAKLARENRLRERRLNKEAKREARRHASSDQPGTWQDPPEAGTAQPAPPDSRPASVHPAAATPAPQDRGEPLDSREQEIALLRLRDAPDEELAIFEGALRADAQAAGASEGQIRDAQRDHPGHDGRTG
jgi:hypothetical protein